MKHKDSNLYSNGLKISSKLAENLNDMKGRVMTKNKASLFIITGGVGEGKTTLGTVCGDYLKGSDIDLKNQIAIGADNFLKQLAWCYKNKKHILVYDEGGDYAGASAMTVMNRNLNRVFDTYRSFKIIIILILPDFTILDKNLYNKGIVRGMLRCKARTGNEGNYDGFSLYRIQWLLYWAGKLKIKQTAFKKVFPNFRGHFKNLDKKRSKELEKLSTKGKIGILEEIINMKKQNDNYVTYKDIQSHFRRSRSWVNQKLKEYRIKPEKKEKRFSFFNKNTINAIEKEINKKEAET